MRHTLTIALTAAIFAGAAGCSKPAKPEAAAVPDNLNLPLPTAATPGKAKALPPSAGKAD